MIRLRQETQLAILKAKLSSLKYTETRLYYEAVHKRLINKYVTSF